MIFRAIDGSGDWQFGQGRQNYLRGDDAVALNIATRLRCFFGDCFWATDFGVDWWNLLGSRNPSAQVNVILQTRTMIAKSFGVVRINSVEAVTDRVTRKLRVEYNVDTIFSRGLAGSVQP
jgi:hypothetical protein